MNYLPYTKSLIFVPYIGYKNAGLMGPQTAATVLTKRGIDTIVVGISQTAEPSKVMDFVNNYFGAQQPLVGFSYAKIGRNLSEISKRIMHEGGITVLGGPEAEADYTGEVGKMSHPHRYQGCSGNFSFAVQGPAEQLVPIIRGVASGEDLGRYPGLSIIDRNGSIISNRPLPWDKANLIDVDWNNMFYLEDNGIINPIKINYGQVLGMIGCPYTASGTNLRGDVPGWITSSAVSIPYESYGCGFCAIAADKGHGLVFDIDSLAYQAARLPEREDGRKVAFEIINEAPIPSMKKMLEATVRLGIKLSTIYFLTRSDYFIWHEKPMREAIEFAGANDVNLYLDCIGFESYNQNILDNLGKGTTVQQNLWAVALMRKLSKEYRNFFYYTWNGKMGRERKIYTNHGLITPTPWDTKKTLEDQISLMEDNNLFWDVHARQIRPLHIYHSTPLGAWARAVEEKNFYRFSRDGDMIQWLDRQPELLNFLVSKGFAF